MPLGPAVKADSLGALALLIAFMDVSLGGPWPWGPAVNAMNKCIGPLIAFMDVTLGGPGPRLSQVLI